MFEEDETDVGNARFEWSDKDLVGRIALRRRRAVRHRWVRGRSDYWNPRGRIASIRCTEAHEDTDRWWYLTQGLHWRGEVTGRNHDVRTNQCAACEAPELDGLSGIIDAPNHDRANIRIAVVRVNGRLRR